MKRRLLLWAVDDAGWPVDTRSQDTIIGLIPIFAVATND